MASSSSATTTGDFAALLSSKQKQVEALQAQLQDYNNACQRLENALIQEQLRSKQLADKITSYEAMLTLKDTQLEELRVRLKNQLSPSPSIPNVLVAEKEVVISQSLQRSASATDYADKEFLPIDRRGGLQIPLQSEMVRSRSFSDKLPISQGREHRASSEITFDALGVPAMIRSRRAAELKEPKSYSSKPNFRYYGRNEGG